MVDSTRIASTPLLGLRPLGAVGDRNHATLVSLLTSRLGPEYAILLAEPEPLPDGSRIDWYVSGGRRAILLNSLPEETAVSVRDKLAEMRAAIERLAANLEQTGNSGRSQATALRNILTVPGEQYIYALQNALGDAIWLPVLTAWAHDQDGRPYYAGALEGRLVRVPARVGPQAITGSPAFASGAFKTPPLNRRPPLSWLLWLSLLVLLGTIGWFLLAACGINSPTGGRWLNFCRLTPVAAVTPRGAELDQLAEVARELEQQLADRAADCSPPSPPPQRAQTQPQQPDVKEAERRAERDKAQKGELEFTLSWNGKVDLDLHVTCPNTETINFGSKEACGGGQLDVDRNMNGSTAIIDPVEHITWPLAQTAPRGRFIIKIVYYDSHADPRSTVDYVIFVKDVKNGKIVTETFRGTLQKLGSGRDEKQHEYKR